MKSLRRSFDVYYRDAARTQRMDVLNRQFVPNGGLAFDIGAHVGDRTASFLRLGARVVCVEPQPRVHRALRLLFAQQSNVALHRAAVGATPGTASLFVNTGNPTVSTLSSDMVRAAPDAEAWRDQVWDNEIEVPVTTLDALITRHGTPDFIKIDVEGFEADALRGLSTAVPVLSFEVTTLQRTVGDACIRRLAQLGPYRFNLSLGEDHHLRHTDWLTANQAQAALTALPDAANSGDIFARLETSQA